MSEVEVINLLWFLLYCIWIGFLKLIELILEFLRDFLVWILRVYVFAPFTLPFLTQKILTLKYEEILGIEV